MNDDLKKGFKKFVKEKIPYTASHVPNMEYNCKLAFHAGAKAERTRLLDEVEKIAELDCFAEMPYRQLFFDKLKALKDEKKGEK